MDTTERHSTVQSIERAANVLEAVAERAEDGISLAEVVGRTGLNRATAHRILKSLVETGLADQDSRAALYFPGIKLVGIAASASNRYGLARRSQDGRARIAERTGDTVFLTLRLGAESICVARTEGSFPIKTLTLDVGSARPLGIGAGSLAMFAFLPEATRTALAESSDAAYCAFDVTSADVEADAARSRTLGYALDDGRIIPGITGIGVPVRTNTGEPIAALSVAAISERMRGRRRANVVTWLREETERLEAELAPLLSSQASAGRPMVLGGARA